MMRFLSKEEYHQRVLPLLRAEMEKGDTVVTQVMKTIVQLAGSADVSFVWMAGEGIFGQICRRVAVQLRQANYSCLQWEPDRALPIGSICLCGGELPEQVMARLKKLELPIVSIGEPQGIEGSMSLRCDLTILFYGVTEGLLCKETLELYGRVELIEGTFPDDEPYNDLISLFTVREARRLLRPRSPLANKYDFGHLVTLGGSCRYGGAPFLAATAALRMGAGLSTLLIPGKGRRQPGMAALMVYELKDAEIFQKKHLAEIRLYLAKASAVLCGPGISLEASPDVIGEVLALEKPVVLDADALNILARHPEIMESRRTPHLILTPHEGELKRLAAAFVPEAAGADARRQAHLLAQKLQAIVVQKGHYTWVHHGITGREQMILSGNVALATAGTGDVLAGCIGALVCQMPPEDAACLGTYLHGLAADLYPYANRSMMADDLLDLLPKAISQVRI